MAESLYGDLKPGLPNLVLIDGDVIRKVFGDDVGHTLEGRKKNADRICSLCKFFDTQKIHAICAVLSIFHESQEWNRANLTSYFEVFIDTPFERLLDMDGKGLYKKARAGEIKNVVGVDIPFPAPKRPDLVIRNDGAMEHLLSYKPTLAALFD